jgi:HEAT repeat protein
MFGMIFCQLCILTQKQTKMKKLCDFLVSQALKHFLVCFPVSMMMLLYSFTSLAEQSPKSFAIKCTEINIQQIIDGFERKNSSSPLYDLSYLKECYYVFIPALIRQTNIKYDERTRVKVILLIGSLEENASSAIPHLTDLSKDQNRNVRAAAIASLSMIGSDSILSLRKILHDGDPDSRSIAAISLLYLGINERDIGLNLALFLQDSDNEIRSEIISALGWMGSSAKDAVPSLIMLLNPKDKTYLLTISALGRIGPEAKDAIPYLIIALQDSDSIIRSEVILSLRNIGSDAILSLIKELRSPDFVRHDSAVSALVEIGEIAIPNLITALKDSDVRVSRSTALVLDKIKFKSKAIMPTESTNSNTVKPNPSDTTFTIQWPPLDTSNVGKNTYRYAANNQPKICGVSIFRKVFSFWCSRTK